MKRTSLSLLLAVALVASAACERRGDGTGTTGGDTSGPIKVGVYGDLSGQTSSFGQSTRNGITMAFDEINKAGGVNGRQLQMLYEDDQGQPAQAATVVTKLINQDKVVAVLGEVASTNSLAAAPIAQQAKVPMITPSSTNPKVTQVGDYIFRVCFTDDFQGAVMAKFAANTLKAKTAAVLGDVNSDYSKGMTQYFEQEFNNLGGRIVTKQAYTQTDADFKGQLTAIRSASPDVIFVPGYYGQVGVIAKQAKELGIKAPLLGGDGWDAPQLFDLGGEDLNGSYMANHYSIDDPSPSVQKFVAAYKQRYGGTAPDAIAALAYDAAYILADAMKRANSTDPTKVRDALAQTKGFAGVTGSISINESRDAVKPAVVFELQNRKFVYKETISPGGSASAGTAPAASPAGATTAASPAANAAGAGAGTTAGAAGSNANNTNVSTP
ncbi:MAG TPA: ABC transporter substrate-binding protein [Pyrinomonadaceae bacterium]|nr:ABC transporter substrate-binding protein [Pyrinomonadaceae bacterium]